MLVRRRVLGSFVALLLVAAAPAVAAPAAGAPAGALSGRIFVIDPGHGTRLPGGDWLNTGAAGPHGVAERDVVLGIGEKLARRLRALGARVVLTRSYAAPIRTATNKSRDNRARAKLANEIGATAFLSLHADSSTDPAARGTSVFWLHDDSVALAPLGLGESQFRARDLAVTDEARVPAVLIELGFLSNPGQERLLSSAPFQEREAEALARALLDLYSN